MISLFHESRAAIRLLSGRAEWEEQTIMSGLSRTRFYVESERGIMARTGGLIDAVGETRPLDLTHANLWLD